ncbi:purine-nucleoside phosphorylase [Spirochaeta dissipatitropha]
MKGIYEKLQETLEYIRGRCSTEPEAGIVLGSGLGGLVERIEDPIWIDYHDIPHFPVSTVAGHAGKLVFGRIGSTSVVAMQGRFHYYEGHDMRTVVYPVALMKLLGAGTLLVSNSAGGMNPDFTPGDLMLIHDHINLFSDNPLIGLNDERLGPRFPDMTEPYSSKLIALAERKALAMGFDFQKGVYVGVSGPAYETAAEIRFMQTIGGDAVGMSTVPEVIAARYMGMEVIGISCITNMSTGIAKVKHSHEEVVKTANAAAERFCTVVAEILKDIGEV